MALRSAPNGRELSRYAYAIPKRVGTAVARNRVRRRLREALRSLPVSEGYDLVISVRQEAAAASFHALLAELTLLLRRARLIDAPAPPPDSR
jgi:ribonuclease P protein component